nr:reverse transcriptase domain-containing protein [Tanacetum cinerariifolium]
MEGYYNARVRSTNFRPGDFVYRNNEASHAEDGGKLGPKWEGPYEVIEALGKGAYRNNLTLRLFPPRILVQHACYMTLHEFLLGHSLLGGVQHTATMAKGGPFRKICIDLIHPDERS